MTFNGSWGYLPSTKDEDWHSARGVVKMLRTCANGGGNLLLNIGPKPDGTVPERAVERLTALGKWTNKNAEAIYGETDPTGNWWWDNLGPFTRKGRNVYYFVERWAAGNIVLGGYQTKLKRASFLHNDRELDFEQDRHRIVFKDMPVREPERSVGITVIKLEFASTPKRPLGADYPCPRK